MAKAGKGKEGASRVTWRVPTAEEISPGDVLQFYSPENSFQFRVLSLQHGGDWIFGYDTRDPDGNNLGPIAVKRSDCMTPEIAARVLKDLPTIRLDAPQPILEV
jgi:hypothetical protein